MADNTTLREFLSITITSLPEAAKSFAELTAIAEAVLYSTHRQDKAAAARAEQLAATIKEELTGETA